MTKSNTNYEKDIGQIATYQSGIAQATAHRIINRIVSEYLIRHNLTAMQWFIIGHIYDAGDKGIKLGDLNRLLGTTLPYITNTINLLESKEIVFKKAHATDNRTKLVSINPAYRSKVEEIEAELRDELRDQLYKNDHITRDELQTYITVLYKMVEFDRKS